MTATPEALDAAESIPQALPEQPAPESDQVTPLLWESFSTVAVNGCVCPTWTAGEVGARETEIAVGPLAGMISMALTIGFSV